MKRAVESERGVLWLVFAASLILSCIATAFNPVIGRDAARYLDVGRVFTQEGLQASLQHFDWPWFPILLAKLSQLIGVGPELPGRVLCEVLTAVACVLCVDLIRRTRSDLLGWGALVVLAIPAFNGYRGDILRENGFWCFSMLALWAMQSWVLYRRAGYISAALLAVVLAAAFRLEAVYLVAVLPAFWVLSLGGSRARRILVMAAVLLVAVGAVALLTWANGHGYLPAGRVSGYVARLDFGSLAGEFKAFAGQLAALMPFKYARGDAELILFVGLAGYLVYKLAVALGLLTIPFAAGLRRENGLSPWRVPDIALFGYVVILMVYLIDHLFLSLRYVVFAGFLMAPRAAQGMRRLGEVAPRLKPILAGLLVLMALANVVSISAPKTQVRDAGLWMGEHLQPGARIYTEDNRLAYFAGWGYGAQIHTRAEALALRGAEAYEYFALDLKRRMDKELPALEAQGLVPVAEFENRKGEAFVILRRASAS